MAVRSYDADPYDEAEERVDAVALAPEVEAALASLAPGHREALRLRVVDELEYRAIADRLGISDVAARTRVSRALSTLRTRLQGAAR